MKLNCYKYMKQKSKSFDEMFQESSNVFHGPLIFDLYILQINEKKTLICYASKITEILILVNTKDNSQELELEIVMFWNFK